MQAVGAKSGAGVRDPGSVGARCCATGIHVRGSYFPIGDRALPPVKP